MPLYHVPSGATLSGLCPRHLSQTELQDAVQVYFKQKRQVIDTSMCLLSLFTAYSSSRREVMSNIGSLTTEDSSTLGFLTRFWEAIAPEGAQLVYTESTLLTVVSFLTRMRVFAARMSSLDSHSTVANRVSKLCSQIIATFLVTEPLPLPSPVEKGLCLMIFDLALTDKESGPRNHSFTGNTVRKVLDLRQDKQRFDAFGRDLQVRASKGSN